MGMSKNDEKKGTKKMIISLKKNWNLNMTYGSRIQRGKKYKMKNNDPEKITKAKKN